MKKLLLNLLATAFLLTGVLSATSVRADESKVVSFGKGKSETTISGKVSGNNIVDYILAARAGQTLIVDFKGGKGANYFNVMPPNSTYEAVFVGSRDGNHYEGELTSDGNWVIRVYLMGAAKDSGKPVNFKLKISIPPSKNSENAAANSGTKAAEQACLAEVAKTTGVNVSKLAISDVSEAQSGINVMIKVPDATAPWSCLSSKSGKVDGVTFTGSEGSL
jgi:hypothetical protein